MLNRFIVTLLSAPMAAFSLSAVGQTVAPTPLQYTPLATPCRAVDTRGLGEGGPVLGGTARTFSPFAGACNVPVPADGVIVYAMNVTAVPHGPLGYLTVWPSGEAQPLVSTLNSIDGRVKANEALVTGGTGGTISVYATNTTDLVLDVSGYFTETTTGYVYVPVTPCRVLDTRNGTGGSGLGAPAGPPLAANQPHSWQIAYPVTVDSNPPGENRCNLPFDAMIEGGAYSMNITVVPINNGPVGYVTVWGGAAPITTPPLISNVNAQTGTVTANAAIINGGRDFTAYASNATDLVIDVTGWFAPAKLAPQGLSLYSIPPCRGLDTRELSPDGLPYPTFPGTIGIAFTGIPCNIPPAAKAYVMNATVVPTGPLGYLTLWPDGLSQPVVSTLNAQDGYITSNMAIVGAGILQTNAVNPAIEAYAPSKTHLILDLSGYLALNALTKQPKVVFIGDETTGSWPMTGHPNWINKGVKGNTTTQMLARFQTDVIDLHPDVVHIMGGAYDALDPNWPPASQCGVAACGNIIAMMQMAQAAGIQVVVGTPLTTLAVSLAGADINEELLSRQLRLNHAIGLVQFLLDYREAAFPSDWTDDGFDPNANGYAVMTSLAEAETGVASGTPVVITPLP